jgi:hypothetical protein
MLTSRKQSKGGKTNAMAFNILRNGPSPIGMDVE